MQINDSQIDSVVLKKCPEGILPMVELASKNISLYNLDFFTLFDLCEIEPLIIKSILPGLFLNLLAQQKSRSTCLDLSHYNLINNLKKIGYAIPDKKILALIKEISDGKFKKVISDQPTDYLPLLLINRSNKFFLYINKNWNTENNLNQRLKNISFAINKINAPANQLILDEIFNNLPLLDSKQAPRLYNDEQKEAIKSSLEKSFLIITGGPGTGKTFTLTGMVRAFLRSGIKLNEIALASPTAKAANKMRDSIRENISTIINPTPIDQELLKIEGFTLHRLLGVNQSNIEGNYSEYYSLPMKVLVVDESSMIDLYMMNTLINSINFKNTKLILMGDRDQLPSVDAGAILTDLIPIKKVDYVVSLTETYRAKGRLLEFVGSIKSKKFGKEISVQTFTNTKEFLEDADIPVGLIDSSEMKLDQLTKEIKHWIDWNLKEIVLGFKAIKKVELTLIENYLEKFNRSKILSVINKGHFGVDNLNEICIKEILNITELKMVGNYFHGMPIQILINSNAQNLFNGDIGVVIHKEDGAYKALFIKNGLVSEFAMESLPFYQPAYATSVHKSQGSEYENVMLVIPKSSVQMDVSKQLLYTGISRAKLKCLIISSMNDFQNGLDNEIIRTTGVSLTI